MSIIINNEYMFLKIILEVLKIQLTLLTKKIKIFLVSMLK